MNKRPETARRLLTADETAAILRLDALGIKTPRRSVLRMVRLGHLRGVAIGKHILIDARSVDEYVEAGGQ